MPLIRRFTVPVILSFALVFCASAGAATAHPRIFLSEAKLGSLRARAGANDPDWKALKSRCDRYQANKVEFPDGQEYPSNGGIGSGYEGSSYFAAVADVGLCYQVALAIDPTAAARYGAVGAAVLEHMSAPKGDPHFQDPKTNDGYGIRFYAAGMALGYDWLFPVLSPALKTRVTESIQTWIASFEKTGFERDFPQGNYFAGYYAAKAYAGMALAGDSATGDQILSSWQNGLQNGLVQPYSAANLSGGGWPEGWNYGPLGVTNMSLPAVAAQTALGADLVHDPARPFTFPVNTPRYLLYFTWPNMKTLDDADKNYEGDNPTATDGTLFSTEAGVLHAFGDSFAPYFTSFAGKIRELSPGKEEADLWENFLFWDPSAPQASYTQLPLSYLAHGMEAAAMRSDWSQNAVWGTFKSGPYTNSPEAGWQYFDEGSLAIVNGSVPFLVNAPGALMRNTPGSSDGGDFAAKLDDDLFFGNPPNRDLFNVFYVNKPTPEGQTDRLRSEGAKTQMRPSTTAAPTSRWSARTSRTCTARPSRAGRAASSTCARACSWSSIAPGILRPGHRPVDGLPLQRRARLRQEGRARRRRALRRQHAPRLRRQRRHGPAQGPPGEGGAGAGLAQGGPAGNPSRAGRPRPAVADGLRRRQIGQGSGRRLAAEGKGRERRRAAQTRPHLPGGSLRGQQRQACSLPAAGGDGRRVC